MNKRITLLLLGACLLLALFLTGRLLWQQLRISPGVKVALLPEIPTDISPVVPSAGVNLNTASRTELLSLPGIGPHLADQILLARERHPFLFLEDLRAVPGIGDARLSALQGLAFVPPPCSLTPLPSPLP